MRWYEVQAQCGDHHGKQRGERQAPAPQRPHRPDKEHNRQQHHADVQPREERRGRTGDCCAPRGSLVRASEEQPQRKDTDDQASGGFRVDLKRKRSDRHRQHRRGGEGICERGASGAGVNQPEQHDPPDGPDDQQREVRHRHLRREHLLVAGGCRDEMAVDEIGGKDDGGQARIVDLVEPAVLAEEEPCVRVLPAIEVVTGIAHQRSEILDEVSSLGRNGVCQQHRVSPQRWRVGQRQLAELPLPADLCTEPLVKALAVADVLWFVAVQKACEPQVRARNNGRSNQSDEQRGLECKTLRMGRKAARSACNRTPPGGADPGIEPGQHRCCNRARPPDAKVDQHVEQHGKRSRDPREQGQPRQRGGGHERQRCEVVERLVGPRIGPARSDPSFVDRCERQDRERRKHNRQDQRRAEKEVSIEWSACTSGRSRLAANQV